MGWNGSGSVVRTNGTNTGTGVWAADAATPVNILSTRHDLHDEDLADAIENTIARDGQNAATANLPMGTFRHTNVGDATAVNQYATAKQVQNGSLVYTGATGGSANAYTASISPTPSAYATGMRVIIKASFTNSAAATLNLNSLGAKNIRKEDNSVDLASGEITSGYFYELIYDGTQFILLGETFTGWATWVPTISGSGAMTLTPVTVTAARSKKSGAKREWFITFSGTIGGTPDTDINISLPSDPVYDTGGAGTVTDNSTKMPGMWYTSGTNAILRKYNSANWTAGAFDVFIQGFYEEP